MPSVNLTPEQISAILQLLNTAATAATHGIQAWQEARALAEQMGITKEDLDAADARFAKVYPDPLGGPTPPTPGVDVYAIPYDSPEQAKIYGKTGDKVYLTPDGHYRLVYGGAGFAVDPSWTLVTTIG